MAKTSDFLSQTSGKLNDQFTTRQTAHGTILARNARKTSTPRRSEKQARGRCQMPNIAANFKLYDGKLMQAFEGKQAGVAVVCWRKVVSVRVVWLRSAIR